MVKIKRNWLYDVNTVILIFMSSAVVIGVVSLLFINIKPITKEEFRVIKTIYNQIFNMSLFGFSIYPFFAFGAICPQMGKEKIYLNTSNLPFSKKQLFWKGIKGWLMIFPIYLLVGILVGLLVSIKTETSGRVYLCSILQSIAIIVFLLVLQMQVIAAIILVYAKRIKWYKAMSGIILGNIILMELCMLGIEVFNIDTLNNLNWMFGILVIFILGSIILLSACWQDVENINR
ncbi:hypothetical protein GCM10008908_10560 [Clostridium subterminale]|uniref:ABC transporter permease n=1 Tax=Clostridium subterminale TaxID=1550 RepID=A0ABN1KK43_CLOSU